MPFMAREVNLIMFDRLSLDKNKFGLQNLRSEELLLLQMLVFPIDVFKSMVGLDGELSNLYPVRIGVH